MKEKDIIKHVVAHWDYYFAKFNNIVFQKEEYHIHLTRMRLNSRVDILAYRNVNNKRIPIAMEVKLSSMNSSRDLVFELEKLGRVREYHKQKLLGNPDFIICVLSDKLDETTLDYMKKNQISWFKYTILPQSEIVDDKILKVEYIPL